MDGPCRRDRRSRSRRCDVEVGPGVLVRDLGDTFLAISANGVNQPGVNDPVYDYQATLTAINKPEILWAGEHSTPTANWNENGLQTGSWFSRGVGVFTPHGTIGAITPGKESDSYVSGSGLWVGSPVDNDGNAVEGTTTLSKGAMVVLTLRAEMNSEDVARSWNGEVPFRLNKGSNAYLYGPRLSGQYITTTARDGSARATGPSTWGNASSRTIPVQKGPSNGWRTHLSGARVQREFTSWDREGRVLTGTVSNTLMDELKVSHAVLDRQVRQRFNQILVNTSTLWEAPLNTDVVRMTWRLEVVSGTVTSKPKRGAATTVPAATFFSPREITIAHSSNPLARA